MELIEKTLNQSYVFKGKIINTRLDEIELPNGKKATREVVEHNGGVCVLPLDQNNNIYFVKQYRYPYSRVVLEIPAGKRDGDENPLDCGIRELKEEVGAISNNIISLGEMYPTPGYCAEIIWIYLARDLEFSTQKLDEDEFLNVEKIHLDKAVEMVMKNEIKDAKTQIAILKTKMFLG